MNEKEILSNNQKNFYFIALIGFIKSLMILSAILDIEFVSNTYKTKRDKLTFGKHEFFFFTNISLFYTIFCVISGILKHQIGFFKEIYIFSLATAFILEILVVVMFWPLFIASPSLVKAYIPSGIPKTKLYIKEFPKHLFPLLILLIELQGITIEKRWSHRIFFIIFSIAYFFINEILIAYENLYLYPFFRKLGIYGRGILFLTVLIGCISLYEVSIHTMPCISKAIIRKNNAKDIPLFE